MVQGVFGLMNPHAKFLAVFVYKFGTDISFKVTLIFRYLSIFDIKTILNVVNI